MSRSTGLTPAIATLLSERHGIITTADLRRGGIGRTATDTLLRSGSLGRLTRGVYVAPGAAESLEHRCRRLSAVHPDGFVTGPTAAKLAGLRRQPRSSELHFTVRHGARLDPEPGVRYHQTTQLPARDRLIRPDGIAVASWPRLAFDLATHLFPLDLRSVIEQMVSMGLTTIVELQRIEARLGHPRRAGSGDFARVLATLSTGGHQDSHPEVELLAALERRGVPAVAQVPVGCPGWTAHVDLGVPAVRWGVELDIHPEHRSVEGHARDARRRRAMHAVGWEIEVVGEADVDTVAALASAADELAASFRRRSLAFRDATEG
ncbi:MAG: type IV toxin-antitoxin system AbiEi family antitoxin domain-containing protein [Desertimonas sp.]